MMLIDYLREAGAVRQADVDGLASYQFERKSQSEPHDRLRVFVIFTPKMDACWVSYFYNDFRFKHRFYDTAGKRTWNAIKTTAHCQGFEL